MSSNRVAATEVQRGAVTAVGSYAVGNNGEYFAGSRLGVLADRRSAVGS
jgi:hypothetical protein